MEVDEGGLQHEALFFYVSIVSQASSLPHNSQLSLLLLMMMTFAAGDGNNDVYGGDDGEGKDFMMIMNWHCVFFCVSTLILPHSHSCEYCDDNDDGPPWWMLHHHHHLIFSPPIVPARKFPFVFQSLIPPSATTITPSTLLLSPSGGNLLCLKLHY